MRRGKRGGSRDNGKYISYRTYITIIYNTLLDSSFYIIFSVPTILK